VTPDRQRIGHEGEAVARKRLSAMGYWVLEVNYRAKGGEIDIVCTKGKTLVFVEVRTRGPSTCGSPEESITAAKRGHLVAAAQEYIQAKEVGDVEWRIDVVAIEYGHDGKVTRLDVMENAVEI